MDIGLEPDGAVLEPWGTAAPCNARAAPRFAIFPVDAVTIRGATAEYRNRHFCPACGSSVFTRSGDEIEVYLGCLDAPNQLQPTYESWVVRRENWLPPFDVARSYPHDREGTGRTEP